MCKTTLAQWQFFTNFEIMASKSKVCFFFEQKDFSLKDRGLLKTFIEGIFKKEGRRLESLNFIFCSDKRLLDINRQFLKHDYYTDIITFQLSEDGPIQAEIYISIIRVRNNALTLGTTFKSELHRVIFHGILHLCGYSDKATAERQIMRKMEDKYLKSYLGS